MADKTLRFGIFAKDDASQAFDKVASAAEHAGGKMRDGHAAAGEFGKGLEGAGERADKAEQRTLGMKDAVDGVATIMQGPGKAGITAYLQGWADLASGFANFIFPALSALRLSNLKATASTVASTVAQGAATAASKLLAGATWLVNAALRANPLGIVITLVAGLVAGIVIAYRRSETFRAVVQGAFRAVAGAAQFVTTRLSEMVSFITGMPGRISRAASGMWNGITAAFRAAINTIIAGWNAIQFSIPGFSLGPIHFGGFTLGLPDIPYLASGGIVTGPTLAVLGERGREAVLPLDSDMPLGVVQLVLDGKAIQQSLLRLKHSNGGMSLGIA